ncbi:MAG: hypothetical protein Q4D23_11680 [Bacteroidales bacterium]|nr:hypothetical protein [Bacteroidales bacterium]
MSVYVVSWGIVNNGAELETDSIVHSSLGDARKEFELLDLESSVKGPLATRAREMGCPLYCKLEEVEMLDEKEKPTNKISNWVFDASKTVLDEKRSV